MAGGIPLTGKRGNIMYTYEYERVYTKGVMRLKIEDHKEVIARRAEGGWRYVGWIPTIQSNGFIGEMDLVFEKELQ